MRMTCFDLQHLRRPLLHAVDGDLVGLIDQFFTDADGVPVWASVRVGLGGRFEVFVPLDEASCSGRSVTVPCSAAAVAAAPRFVLGTDAGDPAVAEQCQRFWAGEDAPAMALAA